MKKHNNYEHYAGPAAADSEPDDRLRRSLVGSWPTVDAFVHQLASDMEWESDLGALPHALRPYVEINFDKLKRDVCAELAVIETADRIYVFDPRRW